MVTLSMSIQRVNGTILFSIVHIFRGACNDKLISNRSLCTRVSADEVIIEKLDNDSGVSNLKASFIIIYETEFGHHCHFRGS